MFIDADDIFLPGRIDLMANCYQKDSNVEIVIGQIGRGVSGEWKPVPTHEAMCKDMKVNLAQSPEIMQSIDREQNYLALTLNHCALMRILYFVRSIPLLFKPIVRLRIFKCYQKLSMVIMKSKDRLRNVEQQNFLPICLMLGS